MRLTSQIGAGCELAARSVCHEILKRVDQFDWQKLRSIQANVMFDKV